jgi:prepilin-type N-terminal cleavage/methylation domain-containing protein
MSTTSNGFTLVEIMIVVAIIGLLTAIAVPSFRQYRTDTQTGLCQNNLRLISHAKHVWAVKNGRTTGEAVNAAEVVLYIKGGAPLCDQGGTYTYEVIDTDPTCDYSAEHAL